MTKTRKVEPKNKRVKTVSPGTAVRRTPATVGVRRTGVSAGAPDKAASAAPTCGDAIGVRELRDSFSERLRSVRAGTTLTVTDHGEPVAMLIPYGVPAGILRMLSEGTLTWSGSKDYPPPLPPVAPTTAPAPDWYLEMKAEDDRALDAAIGASAADLRR